MPRARRPLRLENGELGKRANLPLLRLRHALNINAGGNSRLRVQLDGEGFSL